MSLINKMLQDLDARRAQGEGGIGTTFQPTARPARRSASAVVVSVTSAIAALVLFAGGYAAWRFYQRAPAAPAATAVTFKKAIQPPAAAPAGAPATVVARAVVQQVTPMPPQALPEAPVVPAAAAALPPGAPPAGKKAVAVRAEPHRAASAAAPAARKLAAPAPKAMPDAAAKVAQGRTMSKQQQAEGLYNRATTVLQEGRIREAIRGLEDVLVIEPRHDAARQTLVGLLIEAKRSDEAMRVLQAGLVLDPRQPAMAMLLARLQIEHGGTGIDTLMRSLPYATGDAGYEGFLAGALQRAARHREAIAQYQAAVRSEPGNGVWWMGLGISLQAEKRAAEAADAYSRALSTGALSADLRTFVERRLEQVRR